MNPVPLGVWLAQAKLRLEAAGIETPAMEAQMLAAHALLADRAFVLSHPGHEFPQLAGEQLLQRREAGEPLAYIVGWREFYGRRFNVRPGVLIPRQETEVLVEAAIDFLADQTSAQVLDLGTGSGCLAITIKLNRPDDIVVASDISQTALEVGRENAASLRAVVRFVQSDGFRGFSSELFDLIVTNPPYIGLHETLPADVRDHEPSLALFAGPTGLEFYEMLARTTAEHLTQDGRLMMEVGYRQAGEVIDIFESSGWTVTEVRRDLAGVDRVVAVQPVWV